MGRSNFLPVFWQVPEGRTDDFLKGVVKVVRTIFPISEIRNLIHGVTIELRIFERRLMSSECERNGKKTMMWFTTISGNP